MKRIKYQFAITEAGTILLDKSMPWSETAEEIARAEAYNGEYTIEDDGLEETTAPTAQDDTDALLVDLQYRVTLLELGLTEE